jgi:hypothetical protein
MGYLRRLGIAILIGSGAMAFTGVGIAQATTLFTNEAGTIPYSTGTTLDLSLKGSLTFLFQGKAVDTCTTGTIKGKTTNESGAAVDIAIESLTWGSCLTTTDTVMNGELELVTSGSGGKVTGKGSVWKIGTTGCTYGFGTGTELGTIASGVEPVLKINVAVPRIGGNFLCPFTAGFEAEYAVTEPHALFF